MIKVIKKLRHYTEIEINNHVYNIENEVAYKYQLYNGSTLTNEKIEQILIDNNYYYFDRLGKGKLKNQISEKDLRSFLITKGAKKELVEKLITEYKELNYLNDSEFIRSYINYSQNREGPKMILAKLKNKGINENDIKAELDKINEEKIIERLVKNTLNKRITKNKSQLISSTKVYLVNKGYTTSIVFDVVDRLTSNLVVDETLLIEKEFEQLIKKYQNKKSKEELPYFIKSKLYEKGYNSEYINKILDKYNLL